MTTPMVLSSYMSQYHLKSRCTTRLQKATIVNAKLNGSTLRQETVDNSTALSVVKQIQGIADGEALELGASIVPSSLDDNRKITAEPVNLTVSGSVIDATLKDGSIYSFDFSGRTNSETDPSIVSGKYAITLSGGGTTLPTVFLSISGRTSPHRRERDRCS